MNLLNILSLFSLSLLLFACTSQEEELFTPVKPVQTSILQFTMTRSGGAENQITSLRMIVFDKMGKCLVNTTTPKYGTTFEELVPSGLLNIYFIANELAVWNLGSVSTPEDLKGKTLSFTAYPVVDDSHPIPMFGKIEKILTTAEDITRIEGADGEILERLYAKVSLDLNCAFKDIYDRKIILDAVGIKRMPSSSYLYPAGYTGSAFFNGTLKVPVSSDYVTNNANGFRAKFSFYIPEYLIRDKTKYTYLYLKAHEDGVANNTREYILVIGNGIASHTMEEMKGNTIILSDLEVSRNTHYMFEATIKEFNSSLNVNARVVTWEGVDIPTDYPTYLFSVSRNRLTLSSGSEGQVYVSTDHPDGWKATIANGSGKTAFTGYTSGSKVTASGYLSVKVTGAITKADTVLITSGNITKKILVTN